MRHSWALSLSLAIRARVKSLTKRPERSTRHATSRILFERDAGQRRPTTCSLKCAEERHHPKQVAKFQFVKLFIYVFAARRELAKEMQLPTATN
ncbi:putative exported protein [Burkholderia plantarii]|uniref:Putative exported protein n=1 Tax=Burkholderia plantarii TaxID=41899 RepID=A0A0B6SBS9_BURPL|nr:putative exported protein [Burkholderia plantarii]